MMLAKRVVVCLDVDGSRVVKGRGFRDLRDVGDPAALARRYEGEGADEVVFLDVSATVEGRATLLDQVRRTAESLFVPLTVGGGIRTADDVAVTLRAGADKVSINSAAVARPELLSECAARFGAQCVVASIDVRRIRGRQRVVIHGGRTPTLLDAIEWARRCQALGAGEILLTSIDCDGARNGYDIDLTRSVARAVSIPVIASGGAGNSAHVAAALDAGEADAALIAGILHDGIATIASIKADVCRSGIPVRMQ
jgi:imidazole glycerol-phosphate synthase subunit HisF